MARIPRVTNVTFGGNAGAVPGGTGVFGSLAAGTPTESVNVATIMAAAAWSNGWGSALVNLFPAQEDLNSVPFVLSQQIGEILQDGIAPYDAGTTYYQYSFCQLNGLVYISLTNANTNNNPSSSTENWSVYFAGAPNYYGGVDSGTQNAMALTIANFPTQANIQNGTILTLITANGNTGHTTLTINGETYLVYDSLGQPLSGFDFPSGQILTLVYINPDWVIINYFTSSSRNFYAVAGGTANALTATIPGLMLKPGTQLSIKATTNNTGAVDITISGSLVSAICDSTGSPLSGGALINGTVYLLIFDGSVWRIVA